LLQKHNSGLLPGDFTPIPAFPQIRKTTDLGEGVKIFGFSSPVFRFFLKTGEVQVGVVAEVSQQPLRAPERNSLQHGWKIATGKERPGNDNAVCP
jgi:hypothetical protein